MVRARVQAGLDDPRQLQLEIEITPGQANRARLNRSPLHAAAGDASACCGPCVFSPEDLAIVKGDPSERRRFLDELIVARWPRLAGVRADYDRVLRQRNTLLKSLSGRVPGRPAARRRGQHPRRLGHPPGRGRRRAARRPAADPDRPAPRTWPRRTPTSPRPTTTPTAEYKTVDARSTGSDRAARSWPTLLVAAMRERRSEEIQRGISLVGPHRDDIVAQPRPAAGQGVRQPRRVLVVRPGAAGSAASTCSAPTGSSRCWCWTTCSPSWTPTRRERLAQARQRGRAGAGHRRGRRRRARRAAGPAVPGRRRRR